MSWVVVTGAPHGIGAATSRRLSSIGRSVIVHYHADQAGAEEVAKECGGIAIGGDLSSLEGVTEFAKECLTRPIAGLVSNVGPYLQKKLLQTTAEEVAHLFQTNLFAPMELVRHFSSSLIAHQGRVVHLGLSGLSPFRDDRRAAAYRLSKLALWGYTRAIAAELAPKGVTVNMVSPGQAEGSVDLGQVSLPMGRPAAHEEIALAAVQFFLPEANYITGQNIEVSGGYAL